MKTRALFLFVGLSMAAPLAADLDPPGGPICPFGVADVHLLFDEVNGPLTVIEPVVPDPDSLPCGYAAWIDASGKRPRVGVGVAALPWHLMVTVDLDPSGLDLGPGETVKVLEVASGSPHTPNAAATVSLTSEEIVLAWRDDVVQQETRRAVPDTPSFTLVLVVDRGPGGSLTLSVPGVNEPPLRLGPVDLRSIPITGSPAARVRFGALATVPADLGVSGERKGLLFRPIAIESGWGGR